MTCRRHVCVCINIYTYLHILCCTSNSLRADSSFARCPSISNTAACFMPSGLGRKKKHGSLQKADSNLVKCWDPQNRTHCSWWEPVSNLGCTCSYTDLSDNLIWHHCLAKQLFASRISADADCIALTKGEKIRVNCSILCISQTLCIIEISGKTHSLNIFTKKQPLPLAQRSLP